MSLKQAIIAPLMFLVFALGTTHVALAQSDNSLLPLPDQSGFHPSLRAGAGVFGKFLGDHSAYDLKFLQVTEGTLDYEFCLTSGCAVFMGPYLKVSLLTSPDLMGRAAGGLMTGVRLSQKMDLFTEIGLGYATKSMMINSQFGQTAATYDLTLGVRRHLPGDLSLHAGVTHESKGHMMGLDFFTPKHDGRLNIGFTYGWIGIGF